MNISEYVARDGAMLKGNVGPAVALVQASLNRDGANVVIDGKFGQATSAAVFAFQARHILDVDGIVGPMTAGELDLVDAVTMNEPARPSQTVKAGAPWLTTMRAITGQIEYPGEADSPFVLGMAAAIGKAFPEMAAYCREYTHDSTPWCGLGVAYCMALNGIRPPFSDNDTDSFLWADAWARWGSHVEPRVGAIGVFTRNGGGHVSMIEGITPTGFIIRGGNQSDMVNVITFPKDKLTDTRWPSGWPVVDIAGSTENVVLAGSTR